ncbi:S41 family peptidase [Paenalkalicoccus suaedae]|uniref:C-terminal processing peptidase n=1 Tax=Paenalkalicoccus suaedae TaxID=2592382 RepID=A0A859FHH3_9BACI|nr:S41 family peptidase [Paenalkalicoccus suaedae]QKS72278.1 S41 family peptidase [Paenalkalicoccus suaedae]
MKNNIFLPVLVLLAVLLGAGGMFAAMTLFQDNETAQQPVDQVAVQGDQEPSAEDQSTNEDVSSEVTFDKIEQTFRTIQDSYVNDVDDQTLIEGAISGMLETLEDPYSVYMDPSTAEEFMSSLESSFEGIGAEVSMTDNRVTIVAPFRDSPAEQAGLRPNDQVLEIDGEDIEGLSLYEAVLKIRGEKGTTVTLTIDRPGASELLSIDVVRDEIPIETVYGDIVEQDGKNIGILELRSFSENTAARFEEELAELEEQGIDGLILDVRGNPGGFLQSVEDIGNLIIPGGEPVVQIEDRDGERMRHISTLEEPKDYPIVGLIDEGSASASEILAAALIEAGDYDVVGNTTFGKGTVQQTLQLGDGSQLKLTLFRWLTSDGNDINEVGVEPTIEVDQPEFFYVSPIEIEGALTLDMNDDRIRQAQLMLEGVGFDPGRDDGYFDEETEAAVRSFQEQEGITANGELDAETAEKLQERLLEAVQDEANDLQRQEAIQTILDQS